MSHPTSIAFVLAALFAGALRADPAPLQVTSMRLLDANTGWAAGRTRLFRTGDAGGHWLEITPAIHGLRTIEQVFFLDPREGWAVVDTDPVAGALSLAHTRDGGLTWTADPLPVSIARDGAPIALDFSDPRTGTILLRAATSSNFRRGSRLATSDGGATWIREDLDPLPARVDLESTAHGWLLESHGVCEEGKTRCRQESRLYSTDDGSASPRDITPRVEASPSPDSVFTSRNKKGFDQCAAGTIAQMQSWWTGTPWSDVNIYIGGSNRGCSQSQLTPAWVQAIVAQGWHLIPTWVGPQAPGSGCAGCGKMSTTPATARQQGSHEADLAIAAARALALEEPTIVYYDMEGYSPASDASVAAFVDGWTARMHELGSLAGVYGGASNASADWASITNPPDAVWIASWNGQASVFGIGGLSDSLWPNHQRIHQYQGGHDETWGGVTFNIDSNYEDGPVAGVDGLFSDGFE